MICAVCGQEKELCQSVRLNGIKQPRLCIDCFKEYMLTGEDKIRDDLWIKQLAQSGELESIEKLCSEKEQEK